MIIGFKVWLSLSLMVISTIDASFAKCLKYDEMKQCKDNSSIIIIDVRGTEEYSHSWHFARSMNIPLSELKDALSMENRKFREKYDQDLPMLTSTIVFTSYDGTTSKAAVKIAKFAQFKEVHDYCGGYREWLSKTKKPSWSIVQ